MPFGDEILVNNSFQRVLLNQRCLRAAAKSVQTSILIHPAWFTAEVSAILQHSSDLKTVTLWIPDLGKALSCIDNYDWINCWIMQFHYSVKYLPPRGVGISLQQLDIISCLETEGRLSWRCWCAVVVSHCHHLGTWTHKQTHQIVEVEFLSIK